MRRFNIGYLLVFSFIFSVFALGQTIRLQPYLTGLASPIYVTHAGDGTKRMFVVQQRGIIRVVQPGSNVPSDFMNISSKVSPSGSEQGLLGLAFHPSFETNSFFFVNYTRQGDGATIIARYKATNGNTTGDPNSEVIIMTIAQPFSNHNGGMIEFGPDGHLYIGMGDGGSGGDPGNRAQNINDLLGKMLRITPSLAEPVPGSPYTIPSSNPFVGVAGADEIFALGLRNPWRWSFDRGGTNQLWAGDVGQDAVEEFDIVTLGGNFGWRVFEGTSCTGSDPTLCTTPPTTYIPPVGQYANAGSRCAVTGGYVYRGTQRTLALGSYLYADYCTGEIWNWNGSSSVPLLDTPRLLASFGEDEDGEMYVVGNSSANGTVEKVTRPKSSADFDGDARTDVSVFRPSTGTYYIFNSSNSSVTALNWGLNGDVPVPDDYDGDGRTDIAIYRSGSWYALNSSNGNVTSYSWGITGDVPAAADYDGDAIADAAVFRNGTWYINQTTGTPKIVPFGAAGDTPVVGDYDGDGKADVAIFRGSTGVWYSINSINANVRINQWGLSGDVPVPGDYDGDGKTDLTVWRPSNGNWYTSRSQTGAVTFNTFGANGDVPVPGDYDNDGREDIGVFRPSNGTWYRVQSSNGAVLIQPFGLNGDQPAPAFDAPY